MERIKKFWEEVSAKYGQKFPKKFVQRTCQNLPEREWESFFERCTQPLPKVIRARADFRAPPNWHVQKAAIPDLFFVNRAEKSTPIGRTREHFCGQIYAQSLSSALAVECLFRTAENFEISLKKGLDLCAAPGSKTTFLSQKMKGHRLILANEISASRQKKLAANLDRTFCPNVILTQFNGQNLNKYFAQEFDFILLDAPCSSEAFGRRDSKFFEKMWRESSIFAAAKTQKRLISAAFECLRPGGILGYSTCTSAAEENEKVIEFLLEKYGDSAEVLPISLPSKIPFKTGFSPFSFAEKVARIWPHLQNEFWDSELFFCAQIRKKKPLKIFPPKKSFVKNSPKILGKNAKAEVLKKWEKSFGIERKVFSETEFLQTADSIFLASGSAAAFASHHRHLRAGVKMLRRGEITSEFGIHFGKFASKNFVELHDAQAERFLAGYDFAAADFPALQAENGQEILVKNQGFCLGHFKVLGTKLKNKLDRNLIF